MRTCTTRNAHKRKPPPVNTASPFARPAYVMAKPAGALCNLACKYCYYTEKAKLYSDTPRHLMSDEMLEEYTRQYIGMQTMPQVLFTWHGGETLMRPLSFYRKAVELQKKYACGRQIDNAIQTNATLITDEWARFFRENHFLVGVSIDGPQEFHDEYRRTRTGRPSFRQVMQGIEVLRRNGVEWNALAVVNDFNADYPLDFYNFFKEIGCHYIQFTPVVERIFRHPDGRILAAPTEGATAGLADFSVSPGQWGRFLCAVFDEWVKEDVGEFYVQFFDATLANWTGVPPGICTLAETCGHAGALEFNGDLYSCDHFVFPEYFLGNIRQHPLAEMMYSDRQLRFGAEKRTKLTRQCRECEWRFACNGECPRLRFATDKYGEPGHNYLCAGYRQFFDHVAPYMDFMKAQLQQGEPPANVMQWLRDGRPAYSPKRKDARKG